MELRCLLQVVIKVVPLKVSITDLHFIDNSKTHFPRAIWFPVFSLFESEVGIRSSLLPEELNAPTYFR